MGRLIFLGTGDALNPERAQTSLALPLAADETMLFDASSGTVVLGRLAAAGEVNGWLAGTLATAESQRVAAVAGEPVPLGSGRATDVRVRASVGGTSWTTSIFPDSGREVYVLPIKREVRRAESLDAGDVATVTVDLIDS